MTHWIAIALAAGLAASGCAQEPAPAAAKDTAKTLITPDAGTGKLDVSVEKEAHAAVDRALSWLAAKQKPDGSWSNPDFPALTALPLWAFAKAQHKDRQAVTAKAVKYILACARENGGIYKDVAGKGGGLSNYNTALCMVALHLVGDPALAPVVLKARQFVKQGQHFGGDLYEGGMGYDQGTGRAYTDLSDSVIAFEAMRLTQSAEDLRPAGEAKADLDWEAAKRFLERVQNKDESPENKGGFIYRPDESKAGATTNADGRVVFRSFGSMTYAGMLSLIYADVAKDDPRVKSAFDWSARHWSLEENPGMGPQGLFYFYNVLTKSLSAYGREDIPVKGGQPVLWRKALVAKLLSLQKTDPDTGFGYWINENGRFWESDPVLATAYSLIALEVALGE
jgi:squalene-hopene/tetraprenyl-beta-curcumene cyclase